MTHKYGTMCEISNQEDASMQDKSQILQSRRSNLAGLFSTLVSDDETTSSKFLSKLSLEVKLSELFNRFEYPPDSVQSQIFPTICNYVKTDQIDFGSEDTYVPFVEQVIASPVSKLLFASLLAAEIETIKITMGTLSNPIKANDDRIGCFGSFRWLLSATVNLVLGGVLVFVSALTMMQSTLIPVLLTLPVPPIAAVVAGIIGLVMLVHGLYSLYSRLYGMQANDQNQTARVSSELSASTGSQWCCFGKNGYHPMSNKNISAELDEDEMDETTGTCCTDWRFFW